MKRVRIQEGYTGLVMKNGEYKGILKEGTHWTGWGNQVVMYNMAEKFTPRVEIKILLNDPELASMLTVIEVKTGQLAVRFESGVFKELLTEGKHIYWKWMNENTFGTFDLDSTKPIEGDILKIIPRAEIVQKVQVHVVERFEQGLMFVDGKFEKPLSSGIYFFWKGTKSINVYKADMRQQLTEISGQEILSRDKATLRINMQTLYKIVDIEKALIENKDPEKQLHVMIQLALRESIGQLSIDELLAEKENLSAKILAAVKSKAESIGIEVLECGIRDIILPGEIREILNQVLVAQKKAEANMIMRREETASTRSLLNTAKLMEDNTMLWKMKEMEHIEKIAEKISAISLSANSDVMQQMKEIFTSKK